MQYSKLCNTKVLQYLLQCYWNIILLEPSLPISTLWGSWKRPSSNTFTNQISPPSPGKSRSERVKFLVKEYVLNRRRGRSRWKRDIIIGFGSIDVTGNGDGCSCDCIDESSPSRFSLTYYTFSLYSYLYLLPFPHTLRSPLYPTSNQCSTTRKIIPLPIPTLTTDAKPLTLVLRVFLLFFSF